MESAAGGRPRRTGGETHQGGGEFVRHSHEDADELFFVRSGELRVEFREESDVTPREGEFLVVPRGVEHRPVAEKGTETLLFEPRGTTDTGDAETDRTTGVERLE